MEKYGQLFESIFKRQLTDSSTVSYLENLTREHPYFSVAQFYLLHLSPKNENAYKSQAKKTSVLFNNNHWLNFQLLNTGYQAPETVAPATAADQYDKVFDDDNRETLEKITGDDNTPAAERANETVEEKVSSLSSPQEEVALPVESNIVFETTATQQLNEIPAGENPVVHAEESTIQITEGSNQLNETHAVETVADAINEPVTVEEVLPVAEEINTIAVATDEKTADETLNAAPAEPVTQEPVHEEAINSEHVPEVHQPIIQEPAFSSHDTVPAAEPLLFEPLHTTDYFASVGIKLTEEEKTSGSLGKQLKSFTEWLKTMKKVHNEQVNRTSTPAEVSLSASESTIQKMAEKSNVEGDVITEAMAEVLLQQGKEGKAIEILEKLSLLNPGKSTYFAAKINQIKDK